MSHDRRTNMLKRYTPNYGDGEKASPVWVSYEWNKHLWLPRAKSLDLHPEPQGCLALRNPHLL
jgi:hypothetical protein